MVIRFIGCGHGDKSAIFGKHSKLEKTIDISYMMKATLFQERFDLPTNERIVSRPVIKGTFEAPFRNARAEVMRDHQMIS